MSLDPGSLVGTLRPEDVLATMEALRTAQANDMALRSEQATTGARQAAEQYVGASQTPPPDIAPFAQLLNTLQGHVSSVLARDPSFNTRAQERTKATRSEQFKVRADNLQALRDVYQQRAEEAQKANDLETEEKYRTKLLTLGKQFDVVSANQARSEAREKEEREGKEKREAATLKHQRDLELIRAEGAQKAKGATTPGGVELKALPTPYQYQTQKKGLVSTLNRHTTAKDAENRITQVKSLALGRLRTETSPAHMVRRLDQFNEEMRRIQRKRIGGGKSQADTLSVQEVKDALYRNFEAEEVDAYLEALGGQKRPAGGGGRF